MARGEATLQGAFTGMTIAVMVVCGSVVAALVLMASYFHATAETLDAAVESVRIAGKAQLDLYLHERTREPLLQRTLEGDLQRRLDELEAFVTSEREREALETARSRIGAYAELSRRPEGSDVEVKSVREAAFIALDGLTHVNISDANRARERAAEWDRMAGLSGLAFCGILISLSIWFLGWLRNHVVRPILELAEVVERFAKSDTGLRATEAGIAEVRQIASRFNYLVATLVTRRSTQMAFLAGVAHDLRNPLGALSLTTALVSPERPLPDEARLRRIFEVIRRQTARLERMLGDLLDTVKIEAGQLDLRPKMEDARRILVAVGDLFQDTSPLHSIEISLPDDEVPLRCDALRMEQVFVNLVSNAIKYSPAGGAVRLAIRLEGAQIIFSVSDRGNGISREDQETLFEPFMRGGAAQSDIPGVGLGLFVVRRIVEAHGGRILVESRLGEGSTFCVHIPREPELWGA